MEEQGDLPDCPENFRRYGDPKHTWRWDRARCEQCGEELMAYVPALEHRAREAEENFATLNTVANDLGQRAEQAEARVQQLSEALREIQEEARQRSIDRIMFRAAAALTPTPDARET